MTKLTKCLSVFAFAACNCAIARSAENKSALVEKAASTEVSASEIRNIAAFVGALSAPKKLAATVAFPFDFESTNKTRTCEKRAESFNQLRGISTCLSKMWPLFTSTLSVHKVGGMVRVSIQTLPGFAHGQFTENPSTSLVSARSTGEGVGYDLIFELRQNDARIVKVLVFQDFIE